MKDQRIQIELRGWALPDKGRYECAGHGIISFLRVIFCLDIRFWEVNFLSGH